MSENSSTLPRWRRLLRLRWWLTALVLVVCVWPCWREFAYFAAVSEVERSASWGGRRPFYRDIITQIVFPSPDFRRLVLFKGHDLKSIGHLLPRLRPTHLEAEECMAVDLDALRGLTDLQNISFRSCPALQNIDGLNGLTGLQYLGLFNCPALQNVDGLVGLTGLQDLAIDGCTSLRNADSFAGLTSLESLSLLNCSALKNVDAIKGLSRLKYLALIKCKALQNVDVIKALSGLKRIELIGCTQLSSSSLREIRAAFPHAVIFFPDGTWNTPPP